ncbi:MAG TPA: hypothetical protein P5241_02165 [Candidatus Paceibacterota bacterium]|nr:hypothetical protein [Candidatus Paceibacterota bacterium]
MPPSPSDVFSVLGATVPETHSNLYQLRCNLGSPGAKKYKTVFTTTQAPKISTNPIRTFCILFQAP